MKKWLLVIGVLVTVTLLSGKAFAPPPPPGGGGPPTGLYWEITTPMYHDLGTISGGYGQIVNATVVIELENIGPGTFAWDIINTGNPPIDPALLPAVKALTPINGFPNVITLKFKLDPSMHGKTYPIQFQVLRNGTEIVDVFPSAMVVVTFDVGQAVEEEGDVILNIEKLGETQGDNLRVNWAINPASGLPPGTAVDIYWLNGSGNPEDGNGIFSNDPSAWSPIVTNNALIGIPGVSLGVGQQIILEGQVANSPKELYIKALPTGANPNTDLEKELAVGKYNIDLEGASEMWGKNPVVVPFKPMPGDTVAEVFGEGAGTVWEENDRILSKFAASSAYYTAVYTNNQWQDASSPGNPPNFSIDYRFGNWVLVKANKSVSVVGKVVNTKEAIAIYDGLDLPTGGKTELGMVHPRAIGLSSTSLIADGASEGDIIGYKIDALNPAYITAVVVGGQWVDSVTGQASLNSLIDTIRLQRSYIYVRKQDTGFFWYKQKPY